MTSTLPEMNLCENDLIFAECLNHIFKNIFENTNICQIILKIIIVILFKKYYKNICLIFGSYNFLLLKQKFVLNVGMIFE